MITRRQHYVISGERQSVGAFVGGKYVPVLIARPLVDVPRSGEMTRSPARSGERQAIRKRT